jgi:succinate dehydrogenase / fumarate reductase cytochrome b subunit
LEAKSEAEMTDARARPERPLSPHLSVYRLSLTMAMSVAHRVTGAALYFGTLILVFWLVAAATSPRNFDLINGLFGIWIGRLILFGYTWALFHHLLGGVRHLIWDTGRGLGPGERDRLALATLVGAAALTALVWVVGFVLRG